MAPINPPARALTRAANDSRLPAAVIAKNSQLNVEHPMTQSLKEAAKHIASELGLEFADSAPSRLSSQTAENFQTLFSRLSLDPPETKAGPLAPALSI